MDEKAAREFDTRKTHGPRRVPDSDKGDFDARDYNRDGQDEALLADIVKHWRGRSFEAADSDVDDNRPG